MVQSQTTEGEIGGKGSGNHNPKFKNDADKHPHYVGLRLTKKQHAEYVRLGGRFWLRRFLDGSSEKNVVNENQEIDNNDNHV